MMQSSVKPDEPRGCVRSVLDDHSCLLHTIGADIAVSGPELGAQFVAIYRQRPRMRLAGGTLTQWIRWDSGLTHAGYATRVLLAWRPGRRDRYCARLP